MALTPSTMIPLGTLAPDFSLVDELSGEMIALNKYQGKRATVLMFICNHCPYVKHINGGLVKLVRDYEKNSDIKFIAINANDAENYPEDSPAMMKKYGRDLGYKFPYCFDASQSVAQAYRAACTPDFFVLDAGLRIAYRGQLDDSRPGNSIPVTGDDIRTAIDALVAGRAVPTLQKPSIGCNIKWKTTV